MNSMKRPGHFFRVSIFFSLFLLTVMSATLIEANSDTSINGVTVPDKNLRRYILSYDENQDGSLSDAELKKAKSILISKPIRDFTGISLLKYMECFSYPYKDLIIDYPLRSEKLDLSDMRYLKSLHVGNYVEEIICNNCSKLERIELRWGPIRTLEVKGCTSLERLEIHSWSNPYPVSFDTLDLSDCHQLRSLYLSYVGIQRLNLSGFVNLENLILKHNNLHVLEMGNHPKLKYVEITGNPKLSRINLNRCPRIEKLDLRKTGISQLQLSRQSMNTLQFLHFAYTKIAEIDWQSLKNLRSLDCERTRIRNIDTSAMKKLRTLSCGKLNLRKLDVSSNPNLKHLMCEETKLSSLDLQNNHKLRKLYFGLTNISFLDLRQCPLLYEGSMKLHCNDDCKILYAE